MKKVIFVFIFSFLNAAFPSDEQLQSLLEKKEYFKLRTALEKNNNIDKKNFLYFKSFVDNAFNRNAVSNENIELLLNDYSSALTDSAKAELLFVRMDNYSKLYEYKKAALTSEDLIKSYAQTMDSIKLDDLKTSSILWKGLSDIKKQETSLTKTYTIGWKRDKAGLMNIPVTLKGNQFDFIFDTGANISTINKSVADKLGIKIIDVSFDVGTSTGKDVKSSLCVVDSIIMGDILIKNVVFLVIPDEQLYFPQIEYRVNGIIGYPVIEQLREIRINKNGTITIPEKPINNNLRNLALEGLMPLVSFATENDTLCFHFDTGANHTSLFKPYLDKYRDDVIMKGVLKNVKRGGGGGMVEIEVYELKDFKLFIGDKEVVLPEISVHTTDVNESGDNFYGNIGQDVISQFEEMIINFEYMYIDFK